MSHPISDKVKYVARRVRGLMLLYAISCVLAIVLATALLAGLSDYMLHYQDTGLRVMGSVSVLVMLIAASFFFLYPAVRFRQSEVALARQIERRFPFLHDRLSSSIEFLRQPETEITAGSAALRRAVITQTTDEIERLNLSDALDRRIPLRTALVAIIVFELVAGCYVLDPSSTQLAAERLAVPWGATTWPKKNDLRFVEPQDTLASGADFSVAIVDENNRLPAEVIFEYRYEGEEHIHRKPMNPLAETMEFQLDNVTRHFQYRAVGGDDETLWHWLEVIEPPHLEDLAIRLRPPTYTGWPAEKSGNHIRALVGTTVSISGRADRPVEAIVLKIEIDKAAQAIPVRVHEDGLGFEIPADADQPWTIDSSGSYWFELTDRERGVTGVSQRWEIRAIEDRPPTVVMQQPAGNMPVTPRAIVPISAVVKEDLDIASIELHYSHSSGDSAERPARQEVVTLFQAQEGERGARPGGYLSEESDYEAAKTVSRQWKLAELSSLQPGDYVDVQIVASDRKPQTGSSAIRRLSVVSTQELEQHIGARQTRILGQLAEVLRVQRESRSQTKSLEIQLRESGELQNQDVDHLQSAELNQRQVRRLLSDGESSAIAQIESLLADLEANQLDSPDTKRRMSDLLGQLRQMDRQHLAAVERELILALKIARDVGRRSANGTEVTASIAVAGQEQDAVIFQLEQILGELSEWDNYRRLARELVELLQEQRGIGEQTDQLRAQTIAKEAADLSPQERADSRKLAQRQMESALRLDKLQARMRQMEDELRSTEPLVAQSLSDALEASQRLAIGGLMRELSHDILSNRMGQTPKRQADVVAGLEELLDILANRRAHELERLVEQLEEAAAELAGLREQHEALREQLETAAANGDATAREQQLQRLSKQQEQIADEIERLARRLQRLRQEEVAESADEATSHARNSADAAANNDSAAATAEAEETSRLLEETAKRLTNAKNEAEQELFHEQMVQIAQQITGLIHRQENAWERTIEFDKLRQTNQQFLRAQQVEVLQLSREQRMIADETSGLAVKMARSEAFDLGLGGAAREMSRAGARLARLDTGLETQQSEQVALARLRQLLAALEPDIDDENNAENTGETGDVDALPGDAIRILAELKLLKLMQEEIHRRTAELETARLRRGGSLTPEQQLEIDDLATEQGRLAELILNLSQPAPENPEDDPDSLPDLREQQK